MCASYMIKQRNPDRIGLEFEIRVDLGNYIHDRILPYRMAPVIFNQRGEDDSETLVLEEKQFSLVPSWSKEKRVKFATHNARLETIDEKPTWKIPLVKHRCLVPMTQFIEPIYTGEHAGHLVAIGKEGDPESFMVAAGIFEEWINKETGEIISSFAIVTSNPPPYIAEIGHDRCPIFLPHDMQEEWISREKRSAAELKKFLKSAPQYKTFDVTDYAAMKPGWEKRA